MRATRRSFRLPRLAALVLMMIAALSVPLLAPTPLLAQSSTAADIDYDAWNRLASRTEGLPRALIEAMAAGLPCIGTRVGGIPELLDDEALVAPGDAEALAARIRAFLDDAGLFERQAARNLREASIYAAPRLQRLRDGFLQAVAMNTRH